MPVSWFIDDCRVVRRSLTTDSAHSLIRALVHSRVDYCNGVLAGLPQTQINRLQSILRAAARLVLQLPGWASVSNLMRVQLHWVQFSSASSAPLAFHSAEDSVQAVLGGVQVSSQHSADILTRSLRAYLVFWGSFTAPNGYTFAFHRQKLWQSAGVDFLLPVLRLGTIYPLLWKTLN